jgi:3-mercaptopyruvate sulfurtransferase SseA
VWFVLHELMGLSMVKMYDGALNEWTQYPQHKLTRELTQ